ncbi:hypothetical protein [Gelidibacter japonicus]|uniref:hypothetical protein n=1 Tax=Gelidibacter japonicus TaxID=1962232 RepID=UPI002AFDEA93|nr:hypothetical protein [Gelidibacter japonicus]
MNMRLTLVIVFICSWCYTLAQELPQITHPTPNVMAFNKYGMAPPSLFTGTANISIPIYTINTRDGFAFPISIVYNASGIKVDEIASNVGLGWGLSAGGNITRVVKGRDDFSYGGFPSGSLLPIEYRQRHFLESVFNPNNYNQLTDNGFNFPDYYYTSALFAVSGGDPLDVSSYYTEEALAYRIDGEPDMFSYSLPTGESGKFYLDQQFTPVLVPRKDLRVEVSSGGGWFKITDNQGNEFSFEPGDYSAPVGLSAYSTPPTVSWKLVKIITSSGDEIELTYKEVGYHYVSAVNQVKYIKYPGYPTTVPREPIVFPEEKNEKIYSYSSEKLLDSIKFQNGKFMKFHYNDSPSLYLDGIPERRDLVGSKILRKIEVNNSHGRIKEFQLDQDYFVSSGGPNNDPYHQTTIEKNQYRYRLKLIGLKEIFSNSEYKFEYNESILLPPRFSYAQDSWGYYNGINNSTLIPSLTFLGTYYNGANRDVSNGHSQANMLAKVVYPTQGWTTYEYENNSVYSSEITNSSAQRTINVTLATPTGSFVLNNEQLYIHATFNNGCEGGPEFFPSLYLKNSNNNIIKTFSTPISMTFSLPAGTYNWSIDSGAPSNCICNLTLSYIENTTTSVAMNRSVGGLRLKRMVNVSNAGKEEVKRFIYNNPGTENSSGMLEYKPDFEYDYGHVNEIREPSSSNYTAYHKYLKRTNGSVFPLGTINGSPVGYLYVSEIHGDNDDLGRELSRFSYHADWTYSAGYLNNTFTDNGWKRGLLSEKTVYRKPQNNQNPYDVALKVSEQINNYAFDIQHNASAFPSYNTNGQTVLKGIVGEITDIFKHIINPSPFFRFHYTVYDITTGWVKPTGTIVREYNSDGSGNYIEKVTNFSYNNPPKHLQISQSETIDSKGNTLKTKMYYPDDITTSTSLGFDNLDSTIELPAINSLKKNDLHRVSEVVQTETTLLNSGTVVSRNVQRNNYKDWGNGLVLPKDVQTLKGTNALEDRVFYHGYDNKGNVREVSKADGTSIVYVWGYSQEYPIVKIENATFVAGKPNTITSVQQTLINSAVTASNLDKDLVSENALRSKLQLLRDSFPSAMVTTYTYNPLIGVTSITDPKGYTVYYEYDGFNRLEHVKDAEGNILSKNEYNYKN